MYNNYQFLGMGNQVIIHHIHIVISNKDIPTIFGLPAPGQRANIRNNARADLQLQHIILYHGSRTHKPKRP